MTSASDPRNLRQQVAAAIRPFIYVDADPAEQQQDITNAVMDVFTPLVAVLATGTVDLVRAEEEISEALRAEVERLKRRESIAIDQRDAAVQRAESAAIRERDERRARDRALERCDVLRARLAKVEALADRWANIPAYDTTAYDQGRVDQRRMATEELLAALASAPEPSDSEPAPDTDRRPHSRACGIKRHDHGPDCHRNCPTCGGYAIKQQDGAS